MTDELAHRGPDDAGLLVDPPVVLGHRRLSILDLSRAGHQPMGSEDGSVWLTYNGEIYNYVELAQELRARGHRLPQHRRHRRPAACLPRVGSRTAWHDSTECSRSPIWDRNRRQLFCARDRFGVKPFYYTESQGRFRFASEIKALVLDPAVARKPNDARIFDFLARGISDHTEETMFDGIYQLPPGSFMWVSPTDRGRPTDHVVPAGACGSRRSTGE